METKGQSTRVAQKQVRTTSRSSTTGSSAAPVWSSTRSLSARGNAEAHWAKHREEFPEYRSADEYIAGARAFFGKPPPGTLTKVRPNGDRLFYNPRSNTFGVQARDGAPRTMFRPTAGMEYWNRQ